jgi:hypothetical protein
MTCSEWFWAVLNIELSRFHHSRSREQVEFQRIYRELVFAATALRLPKKAASAPR